MEDLLAWAYPRMAMAFPVEESARELVLELALVLARA